MDSFLDSQFYPLIYVCPYANTTLFVGICSFALGFEISMSPPTLSFSLKTVLAIWSPFHFYMNFSNTLSILQKRQLELLRFAFNL